jgi:hypothetical protein
MTDGRAAFASAGFDQLGGFLIEQLCACGPQTGLAASSLEVEARPFKEKW